MEYHIKQYSLEQGAPEIEYIEEHFNEFPTKKSAAEIIGRLTGRQHLILMAEAPLPADPTVIVPVAFKVAHELRPDETDPKLADLLERLAGAVELRGRRVLYSWLGGTRTDWRGQGHFRALTEQQESWAIEDGFDEILVKTKNMFYAMRGTLDHLGFDVIKFERAPDNAQSKVYMSKRLGPHVLSGHRSRRTVVQAG